MPRPALDTAEMHRLADALDELARRLQFASAQARRIQVEAHAAGLTVLNPDVVADAIYRSLARD